MTKYFRKVGIREFIKDELLGIVFGLLAAGIVALFQDKKPGAMFYIVPAGFGLLSLLINLVNNIRPFLKTDTSGITKFKFALFGELQSDIFFAWVEIRKIELRFSGLKFLPLGLKLVLKSAAEEIIINSTTSNFDELLKDVLIRADSAMIDESTKRNLGTFYKDQAQYVIGNRMAENKEGINLP